jgi:uncharacterized membrane protein
MSPRTLQFSRILQSLAVGALLVLSCTRALAALTICNKVNTKMEVAVAYVPKDAPGVSTGGGLATRVEGWWAFAPGECAQVLSIDAGAHWVSIYAESRPAGRTMAGPEPRYCVAGREFGEHQRAGSPCRGGWRSVGFHRIDTGKRNHTFTIR